MNRSAYGVIVLMLLFAGCAQRSALNRNESIYDAKADARRDIAVAITNARATNRTVVLIFGANW